MAGKIDSSGKGYYRDDGRYCTNADDTATESGQGRKRTRTRGKGSSSGNHDNRWPAASPDDSESSGHDKDQDKGYGRSYDKGYDKGKGWSFKGYDKGYKGYDGKKGSLIISEDIVQIYYSEFI